MKMHQMRNREGAFKQNISKAKPNFDSGPEHQRGRGPGPPRSPPGKGDERRHQSGYGCTLGAAAPPLPPIGPTLQEAVQLMSPRMVAWVLTKNTSPNHHTQVIKGDPSSHSRIYTFGEEEEEGLHTFH